MMKVLILTQEENLYLPKSFAYVCQELGNSIVAIVSSPAMSTHGGPVKGFIKHFRLFGPKGTLILGARTLKAKLMSKVVTPSQDGPFNSLKNVADSYGLPFHNVERLKSEEFEELLKKYQADLLISISCPQIIGKKIRDSFPKGCINVHGAPLPKYRGLMPAFWQLKNNEKYAAATVHVLDAKLDDGDIIMQKKVEILPVDTWDSLVKKTKKAGSQALVEAVKQIEQNTVQYLPNREEDSTYFSFPDAKDKSEFLKSGKRFF